MNVIIKISPIHVRGVFAKENISKGDWQYIYGYERQYVPGHPDCIFAFGDKDTDLIYVPYAPWCFTNHSETPNCEVHWEEETKTMYIVATKRIKVGEEVLIDYGYDPLSSL